MPGGLSQRIIIILLVYLLCPVSTSAQPIYDIADQLDILPTPREITLGNRMVALSEWSIIVASDSPLLTVGAEEINHRVTELGYAHLPIFHAVQTKGPAIVIGRWQDPNIRNIALTLGVTLSADVPGEQGYVIRFGEYQGRAVILLGGSDALGALYACVTFRKLLQRRGGQLAAQAATVTDWPDFKSRCNGRLNLAALQRTGATATNTGPLHTTALQLKEEVNWYLHHKINVITAGYLFPSKSADPSLFALQQQLASEVLQYARNRGIRTRFAGKADVSAYLNPDQQRIAVTRQGNSKFLFSALDAHRAQAQRYGGFLGLARAGMFSFHPNDSGGYSDPGRWNQHAPETRAMFDNSLGRASLEQFMLYFDAARDAAPDVALEAVVYPYHYQFARPDFAEIFLDLIPGTALSGMLRFIRDKQHALDIQKQLVSYHKYLRRTLPRDVSVVFREAGREEFDACADLFAGHPLTIWTYPDCNRGWLGTFTPQVRMTKTFWNPERRDIFYVASSWSRWGDWRVQRLAQQEYMWNSNHPDASGNFTQYARTYEGGGKIVTDFQQAHLIPRICRILYGPAASIFQPLIAANVSLAYVADPISVSLGEHDGENFDDPWKYMDDQQRIFEQLHQSFTRYGAEQFETPEGLTAGWLSFYRRYTGAAAIKAELESNCAAIRKSLHAGRFSEAGQAARNCLQRVSALQRAYVALPQVADGAMRLAVYESFSPQQYRNELEKLLQRVQREIPITFTLTHGQRVNQTTTYGYATLIRFLLAMPSDVMQQDQDICIDVFDRNGERVGYTWFPESRISVQHVNPVPIQIDLGDVVTGDLRIQLSYGRQGVSDTLYGTFEMGSDGDIRSQ
jgi:hypothetical protein